MKKILLFTDALGAGGAQRQLVGLAILLKKKNYDVSVITYHHNSFYVPILMDNDISYKHVKPAENKLYRVIAITKEIKNEKPDVVIAYQSSPSSISCLSKLFIPNIKLIVSERNTSQSFGTIERIRFNLYRIANYVVPNSYAQEAFLIAHAPFLKGKIHVISNFVDNESFFPAEKYVCNSPKRILTVARINRQKNILNYIKAVKIAKDSGCDITVDWYGYADGGGIYKEECERAIDELGLETSFIFHEPTNEIVKEYQRCDALCLPSIFEGTPNVVCEAMSCGVPILCSNICDNPRIVDDGDNGYLFNPLDIKDIARKIELFCGLTNDQINEMRKKSRDLALYKFSETAFVQKYIELIES